MEKKTVCVVTGTRAEYGLLRGVVKALAPVSYTHLDVYKRQVCMVP